jgi:hypothetical protein
MNRSESIAELAAALAAAQAEMRGASKDASNPMFRSKYASLASIWEAAREPLTSNGLSVVQTPEISDFGVCTLTTTLLHSSGEWISSTMSVPVLPQVVSRGDPPVQTAQSYGSALTYARRYALAAIAGIAPDDDDDGNAASHPPQATPQSDRQGLGQGQGKPKSFNRSAALKRVGELGGDVKHAEGLSDDDLIAYGRECKAVHSKATSVVVTGVVAGDPYISEKVCRFPLSDGDQIDNIVVFPQRSCWSVVVDGDGNFNLTDADVVKISGKQKHDEKYGTSIVADNIEFFAEEVAEEVME